MATLPGRSAIQATPAAMAATEARKRTTRIILASLFAECARRLGGEFMRGSQRSLARLGFANPILHRSAHRAVQLVNIGERTGEVRVRRFYFDSCQHGRGIVACRSTHWTNANEFFRV